MIPNEMDRQTEDPPRFPPARLWLWGSAAAYFILVVWLNALQIKALAFAKGVDQTYVFESLTNTVHGQFFAHTHAITNLGGWGLMDHFWPSMLLLVPIAAVFQNILSLYVINGLCLAATGLILARLARRLFESDSIALLAALVFWSMPESWAFALTGNWPEIWAMPFFAGMFLWYFEDRPIAFSISAVAFMGCMEHLLGYVVIVAAMELIGRRRWRWLLVPPMLAAAWAACVVFVSAGAPSGRFFTHAFALTGPRIMEFAQQLFFEWGRSPLLYLSLLWPRALLFILPPALIVTAWDLDIGLMPMNDGALRYAFFIFFPMAVGGLRGLLVLAKRVGSSPRQTATRVLLLILGVHAVTAAVMWPHERHRFVQSPADRLAWEVIEDLSPSARVVTNREIPYAFVGRADAFVGFFNFPFFSIQEFYFDERNRPIPPWTGVEKFAAMGRHTPAVFILENTGAGFTPVTALDAPKHFPYQWVRCGDTNDDGLLDIIVASHDGRAVVYPSDPDQPMAFFEPMPLELSSSIRARRQVAVDRTVLCRISDDHQGLECRDPQTPSGPDQSIPVDGHLEELVIADLDGDGHSEILAVDSRRYLTRIFRRVADGRWSEDSPIPAPPIPTSISVADLDGDGDPDLVVTKSQRLPDVGAFARLVDQERIDHILWFENPLQDDLRRHFEKLGWLVRDAGGLLVLSSPRDQSRTPCAD